MAEFNLEILTPAGSILSDSVNECIAPGLDGEFGVLPSHTNFITPLKVGIVSYKKAGHVESVAILGGYAEVTPEKTIILAQEAETTESIDREQTTNELDQVMTNMDALETDSAQFKKLQQRAEYLEAKLKLAS